MNKLTTTKISDLSNITDKRVLELLKGLEDYYVIENVVPRSYNSLFIFKITKYVPSYTIYKMKGNRQSNCLFQTDDIEQVVSFLHVVRNALLQDKSL